MKVKFFCNKCNVDVETNYTEESVYQLECVNGHKFTAFLQKEKFEILFQIGVNAIVDGYFREAVSSFATSLERFYEYYICIVCNYYGLGISKVWKLVSSQSERQLGAFIFLYFIENGREPDILKSAKVEFRNDVVHKGKIPTKEKTIDFGQKIIDIIYPVIQVMKKNYATEISSHSLDNRFKLPKKDYSYIFESTSLISLIESEKKPNLVSYMEEHN